MKYYLKNKKRGVKDFKVDDSNLLYLTNEGFFINETLVTKKVDRTNYFTYNNIIVYSTGGSTYLGDRKIGKTILVSSLNKDVALFSSNLNLDDLTLQYELINLKDLSLVYDFGRLPVIKTVLSESHQIYLHLEEKLICVNLSNYNIHWELKKTVSAILGVYQNQLLVGCSDHLMLSIDVNTGEILHKWQELPGFEAGQYKGVLPEPADFVLDKEAGKLIGVFSKYYFEIDIESCVIIYEDVRQELNAYSINSFRRMGNNPFTKDHLFVTAHAELDERPNVDLDCMLALNRHTKQVDWVHIFKDSGIGTNVPQITGTHLYQLDTENNLYVFERIE